MAYNINVDIQDLKNFLDTLKIFQDNMEDALKALETDWNICDESWQGDSKQTFEKEFTSTLSSAKTAIKEGEEAITWLEDFYRILEEFEGR